MLLYSDSVSVRTVLLYVTLAVVASVLVAYSQTRALAWDEGFHALAAQLILRGKRPYLDFCFSQTPLNAYWNATILRLFGESWRPLHAAAALCATLGAWLTATFVRGRLPAENWRAPGAVTALLLVGLNVAVVRYGGIAQAYGLCLLAIVAAFRFAVLAVDRRGPAFSVLAGLASGVAAASSLLTAITIPIFLLWTIRYNRVGRLSTKVCGSAIGALLAFIPIFILFAQGPSQVLFGTFHYNFSYRLLNWPGATEHNFVVYASWIDSGPVLLLLLLAIMGLLFIRYRSGWEPSRKAEFYLCAWLAIGIAAYVSYGRPTFERYYVFVVPFLAILAIAGLYTVSSNLYKPDRPWPPVLVLAFLLIFGLTKELFDVGDNIVWPDLEKVAQKVTEVTTPQQSLYADEAIYFLSRHAPPVRIGDG